MSIYRFYHEDAFSDIVVDKCMIRFRRYAFLLYLPCMSGTMSHPLYIANHILLLVWMELYILNAYFLLRFSIFCWPYMVVVSFLG